MRFAATLGVFVSVTTVLLGQNSDSLVRQAEEDFHAGLYSRAATEFSRAVEAEPSNWNLWCNLGLTRIQMGDNDLAIRAFETARRLAPNQAPAYFGLGLSYLKQGTDEKAVTAYRSGLAFDPNDIGANQNYAFLLINRGNFRDAIEPLKRLESLQKDDVPTRATLIEAYFKSGMKQEGEDEIITFLNSHSASMQQELSLGQLLIADGQDRAAEEVLHHAAASWPEAAQAHGDLGLLLTQQGKYEPAVAELGRAAQLNPESAQYTLGLGEALLRWRHDPIALQYLLAVQPRFGMLPAFKFELGLAYFYLTRFPEALKEFQSLAQELPNSGKVHYLLGATYQEIGDLEEAEEHYRKALAFEPNQASYYVALASLRKKTDPSDLSESVSLVEKALTLSPQDEQAKLLLASCLEAQGKLTESQTLLEDVIKSDPDSRVAHVALAKIYFRQKKIEQATEQESLAAKLEQQKQDEVSPWGPGGLGRP